MGISQNLIDSVDKNDVVAIRSSFYTILLADPKFMTNKFDTALAYVKEHSVSGVIDQDDGKILKPECEWDEEYFDLLSSELQDVFSEERIAQLKRVSKVIYGAQKVDVEEKEMEAKTDNYSILGFIALGIVLFFIIRHLFREGK